MKNKIGQKRARLYLREYPLLLRHIRALVKLVQEQDSNVASLVLFGSAARLEPHAFSDADLLALLHEQRWLEHGAGRARFVRLFGDAQIPPDDEWGSWTFSGMLGNAQASDLDEDFLVNVARDGVLLYQQEGTPLPPALAGLQPFSTWLERVNTLLAECAQIVTSKSAPAKATA